MGIYVDSSLATVQSVFFQMEDHSEKKPHRKRQAGPKAFKKKAKSDHQQELSAQQRNPRAFAIQHAKKALKVVQRLLLVY